MHLFGRGPAGMLPPEKIVPCTIFSGGPRIPSPLCAFNVFFTEVILTEFYLFARMSKSLNIAFEKAVRFLTKYLPLSKEDSRKPLLFHDIRVGVYLYDRGYSSDIVLAGVLHDVFEWFEVKEKMVREEFGDAVVRLVLANTKNDSLTNKEEKVHELIQRCVQTGRDALIVKAADILDSFKWYTSQRNEDELQYCRMNLNAIFAFKPKTFDDKIFDELKNFQS